MVYQHLTLVPTLSVLENLMLGSHGGRGGSTSGPRASGSTSSRRLLGVDVDPDARAGGLALGQQQQVEIMKALWRGSRVLILDEPTSMLDPAGLRGAAEGAREPDRRAGWRSILITHKLHEAIELGDRVTVLRAGRVVGSLAPGELHGRSEEELSARIVEMMFGEEASELADAVEVEATPVRRKLPQRELGEVALVARGLTLAGDDGRASGCATSASRCGPARSSGSPASTATGSASWPR